MNVVNITPDDVLEDVYTYAAFAPLVILYARLIHWLYGYWLLLPERFPVLTEANELFGIVDGFEGITLLLLTLAALTARNDFISGPLQMLNQFAFFYIGLLVGGVDLALISLGIYLLLTGFSIPGRENLSVLADNIYLLRQVGMEPGQVRFMYWFVTPVATLGGAALSLWIVGRIMPAEVWSSGSWFQQIQFFTLLLAIWAVINGIVFSIYKGQFPLRADALVVTLPVSGLLVLSAWLFKDTLGAQIFYYVMIGLVWLVLGLHILNGIFNLGMEDESVNIQRF